MVLAWRATSARDLWHLAGTYCLARVPPRLVPVASRSVPVVATRRTLWTQRVSEEKIQVYASTSHDPYLNLSIEQFLLQNSPADSVVLFSYVNRPCVVIGRNQNPWYEVNLGLLGKPFPGGSQDANVELIRRRSGGGAVFHDEGNVNWAVLCPPKIFTRDRHCEMVVRALRSCGIERARVNERHDIVLDQGLNRLDTPTEDTHKTRFTDAAIRPLKVSGSAYKLTRTRALHHGTTLLSSPNLAAIPQFLRSPAKKMIVAKGSDSVSSPVGNIGIGSDMFLEKLLEQFSALYNDGRPLEFGLVGEESSSDAAIYSLMQEMKTDDWLYGQTPHFTFDTRRLEGTEATALPRGCHVHIESRQSKIQKFEIVSESNDEQTSYMAQEFQDKPLYSIQGWRDVIVRSQAFGKDDADRVSSFMQEKLPTRVPRIGTG